MMRKLNLFLGVIVIISLSIISCSKKNIVGTSSNVDNNGLGNLNISPIPATYGNTITITPTSKNVKFNNNDVEVFFTSITSDLRYDLQTNDISIIKGNPDTLRFLLPSIPMDGYMVNIVYNNTRDTLVFKGYAILDEELIKNAVVITSISTTSVNIPDNTEIILQGKNFNTSSKYDTIVLQNNKGEILEKLYDNAIKVNNTGTAITFSIPQTNMALIADVKTQSNYSILLKVQDKDNVNIPTQSLTITNSNYPVIHKIEYTENGTHITLQGSGWNEVDYKKGDDPTLTKIIIAAAQTNNDFLMPNDIFASNDYSLVVKQENMELPVIYTSGNDNKFEVKPYITNITTTSLGTIDYPATPFDNTNIAGISIEGINLMKDATTPAYTFTINGGAIHTAGIPNGNKVVYDNFSKEVTQAGNIAIACSDANNKNVTFAFYKPVIQSITPTNLSPNTSSVNIKGLGLYKNIQVGFASTNKDTIWISGNSISGTEVTINPIHKDLTYGNYTVVVKANGIVSKHDEKITFSIPSEQETSISRIRTLNTTNKATGTLAIVGSNFPSDIKIQFYSDMNGNTPLDIGYSIIKWISADSIILSINDNFTLQKQLYFKLLDNANNDLTNIQLFSCFKAFEMYTATNEVSPILYSSLLTPGSRIRIYGNNLLEVGNLTIDGRTIPTKYNVPITNKLNNRLNPNSSLDYTIQETPVVAGTYTAIYTSTDLTYEVVTTLYVNP